VKERTFGDRDQTAFAALSGDHNPLHVDPLAARRTMFGRRVVHGIHAALWGMEAWLEGQTEQLALRSLRASFPSAIGLGDEVRCAIERLRGNHVEIELQVGDAVAVWVALEWVPRRDQPHERFARRLPEHSACRELSFDEVSTASGTLDLCLAPEDAASIFPNLMRSLAPTQVAGILATTRLVGMTCPGLHSVYSGFELHFSDEVGHPGGMIYRVTKCDARLSLVTIEVRGPGMTGTLKTFIRPAPRAQPSVQDLRRQVQELEFAGQRALIIGGSRGLGEVAAKLLSAGGACVRLTYHRGADDARRVVEDITAGGGSAACTPFDVLRPPDDLAERWGGASSPTHLYYFATPYVSAGRRGSFSAELFRVFCDYFVTGFSSTVGAVQAVAPDLRGVFYPSSIYVEELPANMTEYAAAKMAGESAGRSLEKSSPNLTVYLPRLPRLATDQTATFLPVTNLDPVPVLLAHLRNLQKRAGAPRAASRQ
jgi:MaoC dehydratase-like protein/short subunit dehydrogenase